MEVGRTWSSPTRSGPEGSSRNDFATGRSGFHRAGRTRPAKLVTRRPSAAGGSAGRPGADQIEALFGRFELPGTAYGLVLALIVAVALLTALTSRLAVRRSLSALD